MKNTLLACALLAILSESAHAQSPVTIYGAADAGFVHETGGAIGTVNKLSSGIGSVSRLDFRGNEDLGGGWSANFLLETGTKIDFVAPAIQGFLDLRARDGAARTYLSLDAYSGAVLHFAPYAEASRGHKLFLWLIALHTGLLGGVGGQLLLMLAALSVPVLAFAGLSSYLRGRARTRPAPV